MSNKEEAFEAWWQSLPVERDSSGAKHRVRNSMWLQLAGARAAWLACSQHYEREIEAVAKELESHARAYIVMHQGQGGNCYANAANLLRACLMKGGE